MAGSDGGLTATVVTFVIGGGLTALIGTAVKGFLTLRRGVRAEERETVAELGQARRAAVRERRIADMDAIFWMRTAARYAGQLERANLTPDPPNPVPPSERPANGGNGEAPRAAERA